MVELGIYEATRAIIGGELRRCGIPFGKSGGLLQRIRNRAREPDHSVGQLYQAGLDRGDRTAPQ